MRIPPVHIFVNLSHRDAQHDVGEFLQPFTGKLAVGPAQMRNIVIKNMISGTMIGLWLHMRQSSDGRIDRSRGHNVRSVDIVPPLGGA